MAAQIAQFLVPSDGLGDPSSVVVDWPHDRAFFISNSALRVYAVALATQSPLVSVAASNPFAEIAFSDTDPVSGSLVVAGEGGTVHKYDPATLAQTGSYNPGINIEGLTCVACGTAASGGAVLKPYAGIKQSVTSGQVDVIFADTMTTAGALLDVVSGSVQNRGTLWRGASGPAGASIFAMGSNYTVPQASLPIWCIDILPGAENFSASNPFITVRAVGTLAATDVDTTWSTFTVLSRGYDQTDGNLLLDVSTTSAVTHQRYIAKIDAGTGGVLWATPADPIGEFLPGSRVARSQAMFLASGQLDRLATDTGALSTTALGGLADFGLSSVMSDDTSGLIVLHCAYTSGAGAPVAVSGTPSSFTGWAILAPVVIVAPDYAITLNEDTSLSSAVVATGPDGLVYTVLDTPAHGMLTLNPDGTYTYDAARAYFGADGFTYRATDPVSGAFDDGTVTITVAQAFPLTGVVKVLLPPAELQFCDANGVPYAGGTLEFYEPGTSNPKDTWSSPTGDSDTLNTNPLVLDAAGRALIYGDGAYRTVLRDAAGNLVWDQPSFTYVSACMVPVVGAADLATARQAMGVTDAIEAEAEARAAADSAEATARAAGDATNAAAIAAETARAEAAEAALGARIDALPAPNPPSSVVGGTALLDAAGHLRITFATPFSTACTSFTATPNNTGNYPSGMVTGFLDRFGADVWGYYAGTRTPWSGGAFSWLAIGS